MYRLMYKAKDKEEWSCIGSYTDLDIAVAEMEKLEAGILGAGGSFKIVREKEKAFADMEK